MVIVIYSYELCDALVTQFLTTRDRIDSEHNRPYTQTWFVLSNNKGFIIVNSYNCKYWTKNIQNKLYMNHYH